MPAGRHTGTRRHEGSRLTSDMGFDIVALGEPLYELNQQEDGRFLAGFGGDTSNVVIAASRLGAKTAYVSRLGRDLFGEAIQALWRTEGVDQSAVAIDSEAPTGLYFVTHSEGGHEFTYRRKGSAAGLMREAEVPEKLIAEARYLHLSGISQAVMMPAVTRALAVAVKAGTRISFDTNYRKKLWPAEVACEAVRKIAPAVHVLKTSIEDSQALFGGADPMSIAERFLGLGAATVLVTLGPAGVHVASAEGYSTIPGFKVSAIDATGAGDAFTGAFLAELCRGSGLHEAVRFANAAAALSTLGFGAIAPLPRRADVEVFMRGRQ
jgi:2-dehydro-3-deoxygluconokinase